MANSPTKNVIISGGARGKRGFNEPMRHERKIYVKTLQKIVDRQKKQTRNIA